MKLGIIGGYGFLGYKMANIARDKGIEVLLGGKKKHLMNDGFAFQGVDITNKEETDAFVSCKDIDVVVLTAAISNVDLCERNEKMAFLVNADGPANVANACVQYGVKLVYISTDFVFDGLNGSYTEDAVPNPINVYGKSKLAGEQVVSRTSSDVLICRTSVLYGNREPFQHENFAQWVKNQLIKKNTITIARDQYNSPTLVDDVAGIILKLVKEYKRGIWHTVGSQCVSRYDFSVKIARSFGFDDTLIRPIVQLKQIAPRPKNACLNIDKVKGEMGIVPLGVDEGITLLKKDDVGQL